MSLRASLKQFSARFWFAPQDVLLRSLEAEIWRPEDLISPWLDIGCGDGSVGQLLFTGRQIDVGVDIAIPLNKIKHSNYRELIQADATGLPFAANTFQTITINSTLEHIPSDTQALAEAIRVLKPGGQLFITVPLPRLCRELKKHAGIKGIKTLNQRLSHYHYRCENFWRQILKKYKMKPIEMQAYFSPQLTKLWYRLFRLATLKVYHRELWSYLEHSFLSSYLPQPILKFMVRKYLFTQIHELFSARGGWLFIKAQKKS